MFSRAIRCRCLLHRTALVTVIESERLWPSCFRDFSKLAMPQYLLSIELVLSVPEMTR